MFRKGFIAAFILLSFGAGVLCAADFWVKKKYSEWNQQEVRKMLFDSPWARPVEVTTGEMRPTTGGGRGRGGRGGGGGGGMGGGGASGGGMDPMGSTGPASAESAAGDVPRTTLIVRFYSALPIKQAMVRARYGDEVLQSPPAAQFLSRPETAYAIGIFGPQRLLPADAAGLKEQAQLTIKGREPIAAQNVVVERGSGGTAVVFLFPRAGNPVTLNDDSFELKVKFRSFEVRHRFKLKELLFDGKLEL